MDNKLQYWNELSHVKLFYIIITVQLKTLFENQARSTSDKQYSKMII